jgi:hypothetical protein
MDRLDQAGEALVHLTPRITEQIARSRLANAAGRLGVQVTTSVVRYPGGQAFVVGKVVGRRNLRTDDTQLIEDWTDRPITPGGEWTPPVVGKVVSYERQSGMPIAYSAEIELNGQTHSAVIYGTGTVKVVAS